MYRPVVEPTSNDVCDYKLCYTLLLNSRLYHAYSGSLHKNSVFNRYQLECFINYYSKSHTCSYLHMEIMLTFYVFSLLQIWFMSYPLFQGTLTSLTTPVTLDQKSMGHLTLKIILAISSIVTDKRLCCCCCCCISSIVTDKKFLCRPEKVEQIIVDAGIYLSGRTNFFRGTQKRPAPVAFKFFTGISCSLTLVYFPCSE